MNKGQEKVQVGSQLLKQLAKQTQTYQCLSIYTVKLLKSDKYWKVEKKQVFLYVGVWCSVFRTWKLEIQVKYS
jgi:hypothetical protein